MAKRNVLIMIRVENNIAFSDIEGKELRVIGTGMRGKRFVLINGLTVDVLEEVDPLPPNDEEETDDGDSV